MPADVPHAAVAILGSGFAGLGVAVELKREGIDDLVILERASALGGTWRDNRYPGCACDIPSHLYSFSYAPNAAWSRAYAPQQEIRDYLERCADQLDLRRHVRYDSEVVEAAWDEQAVRWRLRLRSGEALTADVVVAGTGALSNPAYPRLPGLERFQGAQFHSARWDPGVDLRGKRVAVVGTGASAIQFIPRIQPQVGKLYVLQRTPPWILPRKDRAFRRWEQALLAAVPGARWLYRQLIYWKNEATVLGFVRSPAIMRFVAWQARRHLRRSIRDPRLAALLTPSYVPGCKRILLSDDYYPALAQPNVEVIAEAVAEVEARSIALADGRRIEVDALIYGTGFRVQDYLGGLVVVGRGGARLDAQWREGAEAYLGTVVAGFPNFFMMTGPNTGLGHNSMVAMIEGQAGYVRQAVRLLRDRGQASLEVKPEVQAAYNAWIRGRQARTVWSTGCTSWYLDAAGRNTALWPASVVTFRRRVARLRPEDFDLRPRPGLAVQGVQASPAEAMARS